MRRNLAVALAAFVLAAIAGACGGGREIEEERFSVPGGDPERGAAAIARYGCGACHTIPHQDLARGRVGPPLDGVASRAMLAGRLPNTPDNMIRWIMHPQHHEPGTAMPQMGVTEQDARDIAARLYTFR